MSKIQRWDPPRELIKLREQINRFFDDIFSLHRELVNLAGLGNVGLETKLLSDETDFVFKANLPDYDPADIDITIEADRLIISGEKKKPGSYGTFRRIFGLTEPVNPELAKADFKNGVLEIRVPKNTAVKAKAVKLSLN